MKTVQESDGEEMRILASGDVHLTQAATQQSSLKPALAALALGAGIPMAGLAGYLLSQKPTPQPVITQPKNTTIERDYQIGEVLIE